MLFYFSEKSKLFTISTDGSTLWFYFKILYLIHTFLQIQFLLLQIKSYDLRFIRDHIWAVFNLPI